MVFSWFDGSACCLVECDCSFYLCLKYVTAGNRATRYRTNGDTSCCGRSLVGMPDDVSLGSKKAPAWSVAVYCCGTRCSARAAYGIRSADSSGWPSRSSYTGEIFFTDSHYGWVDELCRNRSLDCRYVDRSWTHRVDLASFAGKSARDSLAAGWFGS